VDFVRKIKIAKNYYLGPGKLLFIWFFVRVGGNTFFFRVALVLRYIAAREITSEVNLVSSYPCTKGRVHDGQKMKILRKSIFVNILWILSFYD